MSDDLLDRVGKLPIRDVDELRAVGRKLLRGVPRRSFQYQFSVVDQVEPNAFALPGGYIFISRGLLALANNEDELACVIVEPLHRTIQPKEGFLQALRSLTAELEIPLIFDEVVTGFRLALGGAQEYYGVTPDLCASGKAISGATSRMCAYSAVAFNEPDADFITEALRLAGRCHRSDKMLAKS